MGKEKFHQKLLIEGKDDQHVIWALCEKFEVPQTFDVIDCEGIEKLYEQIPVRFKQSGLKTLGFIIDADTNLKERWSQLRAIITPLGITTPDNLPKEGLVISGSSMKVGVWIMPDNNLNGMLEDFIAFLVPKDDKLLPIAEATLGGIEEKKLNKYSLNHKSKTLIHTWLSWQEDPGTPMGLGITKRYLTTDEETCKRLVTWLNKLFN